MKCLCDPVLLSALPVPIPVRPNDDVKLTAADDVSHFVMSGAPPDEIDTQFNALFSTLAILICFLTGPVQCLLRGVSNSRALGSRLPEEPSRNVRFRVPGCSTLTSSGSFFF